MRENSMTEIITPPSEIVVPRRELIKPGWYLDMDNEKYHGSSGDSSSTCKILMERTQENYKYNRDNPENKETDTKSLGTAFHTLTLEPEKFDRDIIVRPVSIKQRRGADWEAFKKEAGNRTIITKVQLDKANKMADNVRKNPVAKALIDDGVKESSIYWWYKSTEFEDDYAGEYQTMCKVRPDFLSFSMPVVVDLKSADDPGETAFLKAMNTYYYHLSGAMYLEGVNQCKELHNKTGHFAYNAFVYIVVDNNPPHEVKVYELGEEDRAYGLQLFRRAMRLIHEGKRDDWPSYSLDITKTEMVRTLPWATKLPSI